MTGHLNPVRWPPAHIDGTVLIAVGARYGEHVVTADGGLAPYGSTAPERINDSTPRFRITRSGPTLTPRRPGRLDKLRYAIRGLLSSARQEPLLIRDEDPHRLVKVGAPRMGERERNRLKLVWLGGASAVFRIRSVCLQQKAFSRYGSEKPGELPGADHCDVDGEVEASL